MKRSKEKRLRDQADKLFQVALIKMKPVSVVSGEPTEVIHHFVPKAQSNNLRYDEKNGVPLTHAEHFAHHTKGDPDIVTTIVKVNGVKWYNDLQIRRRIICKLNVGYLEEVIKKLNENCLHND